MGRKAVFVVSFFIVLMSSFLGLTTRATTWNEPWHEQVLKEAESFVLAEIVSVNEEKGLTVQIIYTLAGKELSGKIKINDFYLLKLCSVSGGHGPEYHFKKGARYYFFIKKQEGKYCIATPTTGFAYIGDDGVHATYRHSYHQAAVPVDVYEKTMTAIYHRYHNNPYDLAFINEYVDKYITLPPAGFDNGEMSLFFSQHVSLECIYHLNIKDKYSQILPFLRDTSNIHNQISAARALSIYDTPSCRKELLAIVVDSTMDHFVQVMCLRSLASFHPVELKVELTDILKNASNEHVSFGGNIMDPRICTSLPSVKEALKELLEKL